VEEVLGSGNELRGVSLGPVRGVGVPPQRLALTETSGIPRLHKTNAGEYRRRAILLVSVGVADVSGCATHGGRCGVLPSTEFMGEENLAELNPPWRQTGNVVNTATIVSDATLLETEQNFRCKKSAEECRVATVTHGLVDDPSLDPVFMVPLKVVNLRPRCGFLDLVEEPIPGSDVLLE